MNVSILFISYLDYLKNTIFHSHCPQHVTAIFNCNKGSTKVIPQQSNVCLQQNQNKCFVWVAVRETDYRPNVFSHDAVSIETFPDFHNGTMEHYSGKCHINILCILNTPLRQNWLINKHKCWSQNQCWLNNWGF